jgi:hypothetical protein
LLPAPMLPSSAGDIREGVAGGGRLGGSQAGKSFFVGRHHAVRIRSLPSPPPEPLTTVRYRLIHELADVVRLAEASRRETGPIVLRGPDSISGFLYEDGIQRGGGLVRLAITVSSASFGAGVDSSSGPVGRR